MIARHRDRLHGSVDIEAQLPGQPALRAQRLEFRQNASRMRTEPCQRREQFTNRARARATRPRIRHSSRMTQARRDSGCCASARITNGARAALGLRVRPQCAGGCRDEIGIDAGVEFFEHEDQRGVRYARRAPARAGPSRASGRSSLRRAGRRTGDLRAADRSAARAGPDQRRARRPAPQTPALTARSAVVTSCIDRYLTGRTC